MRIIRKNNTRVCATCTRVRFLTHNRSIRFWLEHINNISAAYRVGIYVCI